MHLAASPASAGEHGRQPRVVRLASVSNNAAQHLPVTRVWNLCVMSCMSCRIIMQQSRHALKPTNGADVNPPTSDSLPEGHLLGRR